MAAAVLAAALAVPVAAPLPIPLFGSVPGPAASYYQGRYFYAGDESYRACIADREGRWNYAGTGAGGKYQGTYQMTKALVRGAVWMASKEWAHLYGAKTAKAMRVQLHNADPRTYSREVWDQLFWTVLNWDGPRSGAHHWAGGRFRCTPGMAAR